jgi:hypothetical protein
LSDAIASMSVPSTVKCSSLMRPSTRKPDDRAEELSCHVVFEQALAIA